MAEADDLSHFKYAVQHGRAMVTRDADFLRLHKLWQAEGQSHSGIMFVQDHLQGKGSIGVIVRTLLEYHELVAGGAVLVEKDIANQVIYIG